MCKKFFDIREKFEVVCNNTGLRIIAGVFVAVFVIGAILGAVFLPQTAEKAPPEDTNVYLNEEVCFAKDIYIKVVGLSVDTIESEAGEKDSDGDELSPYCLNLTLVIEQRADKPKATKLESQMFTLKSVNVKSRSKMAIFFEQLAKQTINAALSVAIDGSVNILDDTISFAADYTTEVVNEVTSQKKFKPIKASKNQFEPFKPKDVDGSKTVQLSFPIKQEYLESEKTIVLSIDSWNHLERRIYLITRPQVTNETTNKEN